MARRWVATDIGGPEVLQLVEVELPAPGPGEVTIAVRASGMNPIDHKLLGFGDRSQLPKQLGFEVAGVIAAIGPGTTIASGGGAVGDEVLAYRVAGGYASALNASAEDVFAKPARLSFPEAANLALVGATAAEMLDATGVAGGDTVLLHGASGAVGVSVLQQARLIGAHVIGTCSARNFDLVSSFGGTPVRYGDGQLADRVRALAPGGIDVALDAVGTDEAVDISLALVADRRRILTIAATARAKADGFQHIGASNPASAAYRVTIRPRLIALANTGDLTVPIARTFPLEEAQQALELLAGQHPGGKLALVSGD
jgi:NADPH:quinone reductase-like Zn-dependent oxidoreductase